FVPACLTNRSESDITKSEYSARSAYANSAETVDWWRPDGARTGVRGVNRLGHWLRAGGPAAGPGALSADRPINRYRRAIAQHLLLRRRQSRGDSGKRCSGAGLQLGIRPTGNRKGDARLLVRSRRIRLERS